jgi:CNT family concentrative nucleoside transporter
MAAPGGLLMAKIIKPETDHRDVKVEDVQSSDTAEAVNIFEAIGNGALTGLTLALNVGAMLLAFVAMIALLNGVIAGVGGLFGYDDLSLQAILGVLLAPLAFLLGVPWEEATAAGSLIGQKFVINEFFAYVSFMQIYDTLSEHTQVIITFALCGFANLSSIAILLGGLGSIAPDRRHDIARLGLMAVLGGTLSNLMSAVLAGMFLSFQAL